MSEGEGEVQRNGLAGRLHLPDSALGGYDVVTACLADSARRCNVRSTDNIAPRGCTRRGPAQEGKLLCNEGP